MKRLALCLSACILAGTASAASAATTFGGLSGTRNVSVLSGANANGQLGQTFTATDSLLTNFGFQFGTSSTTLSSASVTFSLLSGGTTLASTVTTLAGLQNFRGTTAFSYYDVFNGSLALTQGQSYTALLQTTASNLVLIFSPNSNQSTVDAYAGGTLLKSNTLDTSCRAGVCDANFRFTTSAAPVAAVPETATWMMMLTGFGLVGGGLRYRRRATSVRFA